MKITHGGIEGRTRGIGVLMAVMAGVLVARAETAFPAEGWTEEPSRYANPDAPKGGRLVLAAGAAPKSLNYYLENSTFAAQVCSMLYESLLSRDPDTGEYAPALARRWTVSDDGLAFTFEIDPTHAGATASPSSPRTCAGRSTQSWRPRT